MSRQIEPEDDPDPEPPDPSGRIRNTGPGPLIGFGLTGLVLGWGLHRVSDAMSRPAPTVGWLPVLALFFVALIMGSVAWSTYRLFQRHERIEPHRAVNRLVLAKSCALAGALFAGGYFGYALSWLGIADSQLAKERMIHSLLAGIASLMVVVGSLLLERACRVRGQDDRDIP